jgi:uncharacterized protein (TIGR02246 family)
MRSIRSPLGLLALVPLALACAKGEANPPPPPPPAALSAAEATTMRNAYVDAMNKKDVAAAAAVYADDAVFDAPDGSVQKGRAAIQAAIQQTAETMKTFALINERFEASGDLALDAGTSQVTMVVKGKEQAAVSHYTAVFKRQGDGGWKVIHVSQSPP